MVILHRQRQMIYAKLSLRRHVPFVHTNDKGNAPPAVSQIGPGFFAESSGQWLAMKPRGQRKPFQARVAPPKRPVPSRRSRSPADILAGQKKSCAGCPRGGKIPEVESQIVQLEAFKRDGGLADDQPPDECFTPLFLPGKAADELVDVQFALPVPGQGDAEFPKGQFL